MRNIITLVLTFFMLGYGNVAHAYQQSSSKLAYESSSNTQNNDNAKNNCDIKLRFDYEVNGLTVIFKGVFNENYQKVIWDFGDNKKRELTLEQLKSNKGIPHTYEKTGVYQFSYTAILSDDDNDPCKSKTYEGTIYAFDFND